MSLLVIKKKIVEFKNYLIQSKKVVENNRISVPMHYVNTFGNYKTLLLAIIFRRKCTFSPYILTFFHFSPYILILPLLVPKPINACYFHPFRQSTDRNN